MCGGRVRIHFPDTLWGGPGPELFPLSAGPCSSGQLILILPRRFTKSPFL